MKKEKFYWLNEDSRTFLSRGYLKEGEKAEDRYWNISKRAEELLSKKGFADKFYDYLGRGFYSLSTPVICNFGKESGLPVSCYGSYVPDDTDKIFYKSSEIGMMSKMGGGTSGFFGDLRSRGSKISTGGTSNGPISFFEMVEDYAKSGLQDYLSSKGSVPQVFELFDGVAETISQGSARRGSFAAYLPVDHPDIVEFLQIREEGHPIQRMSIAVTITDEWMNSMISGDKEKREVWARILKKRYETGYPYVTFIDNINNKAPKVYQDKGLKIKAQNLCAETAIFSDENHSFVCVLSSINLLHWDEIKETDAVETLTYFLEAVNEEFVIKTKHMPWMKSAYNFAKDHRALGVGVLGWHSYLQSKMIPFESFQAKMENISIWEAISSRCNHATEEMSREYGETDLLKGYGKRNVTTMAVAPTTSSSFILGQISPSIEPLNSNYFVKKLAKGNFTYKNPFLKELLSEKGKDDSDTWRSILERGGSVQHLDFLSQQEKDVFKTFGELSQKEIIIQAAQRQKYIDQGQSLNIMVGTKVPAKEISQLMIEAWRLGVKSLYYQRGANPSQELSRTLNTCTSCEG